jgi:predicted nucleic acid-binding protein
MQKIRAVIDTNVLYSSLARSALLWLVNFGLYRPFWSSRILEELSLALTKIDSINRIKIIRSIKESFPDAYIDELPETEDFQLPDKNDLHILACAIEARAQYIVTFNLKDFPPEEIDPIIPISPDDFCILLFNIGPELSIEAHKAHWRSHKNPKISWEEYTARVNRARLHKLSHKLKKLDLSAAGL